MQAQKQGTAVSDTLDDLIQNVLDPRSVSASSVSVSALDKKKHNRAQSNVRSIFDGAAYENAKTTAENQPPSPLLISTGATLYSSGKSGNSVPNLKGSSRPRLSREESSEDAKVPILLSSLVAI